MAVRRRPPVALAAQGLGKSYILNHQGPASLGRWERLRARCRGILHHGDARAMAHREVFWALRDVSFRVRRGEALGIIGHNGAGKSTVLKLLSRITHPTEGKIVLDGRVASLLEIGTGFNPELTGRENIFLNGALLGMTRGEVLRKFDEIVDFSGVERFLDTPLKRYSSGMYVRLGFAVAANLDPEILIIDEVLAVGDIEFQNKCLGKMQEVSSREGRTVLFVSHSMGAIRELCDRVLVLRRGRMVYSGNVEQGIEEYLRASLQDAVHEVTFEEEPDAPVLIHRLRLLDGSGNPFLSLPAGQDAFLEVDYTLRIATKKSFLAVMLRRNGDPVLTGFETDPSDFQDLERLPGHYRARVRLPMHLFKEGVFGLDVRFGGGYGWIVNLPGVLAFQVLETSEMAEVKGYGGSQKGILRLSLEWESEHRPLDKQYESMPAASLDLTQVHTSRFLQ